MSTAEPPNTTRQASLLLDHADHQYQQLLAREAQAAAARLSLRLLPPEYANGSSWAQVESVNRALRGSSPEAFLLLLAGEQWTRAPFERVVRAGRPVVVLNRLPEWLDAVRRDHPSALVAAVAPRQEGIGEIQARQALRIAPAGSFVLLVTGDAKSPAAVARTSGFLRAIGERLKVHQLDGRWSASGARKAVTEWFRFGAERDRALPLVVCQNDAMAAGVRTALAQQAEAQGRAELARTPLVGCDGVDSEGKAMVGRGELSGTVVMPPTTPAALEALARFWQTGERCGTVLLEASSYPPLEAIRAR